MTELRAHPVRLATTFAVSLIAATVMAIVLGRYVHRPAAAAGSPDGPPMGWTEVCEPAAIGDVCRTYPPGDRRSEPKAPLPPWRPLRAPIDQDGSISPPSPNP